MGPKAGVCVFCDALKRDAREAMVLYRGDHSFLMLNKYPYINGHLLVAPARHAGCITELDADDNCTLMTMVAAATAIVKTHLNPDCFNIGCNIGAVAGAGIADHIHVHIVPRWDGDHNFITVISELRTIPEHIEATFDRLAPDFLDLHRKRNP